MYKKAAAVAVALAAAAVDEKPVAVPPLLALPFAAAAAAWAAEDDAHDDGAKSARNFARKSCLNRSYSLWPREARSREAGSERTSTDGKSQRGDTEAHTQPATNPRKVATAH